MALLFIEKVNSTIRESFEKKVIEVSAKLQISPNWLMATMWKESGLKTTARNTAFPFKTKTGELDGYATGLIQFIPSTARHLGTTTWAIEKMNHIQQLDLVYKYFAPYKGKINDYADLYLVTFYPVAITKPDTFIIGSEVKPERVLAIAKNNPVIDLNKNFKITKAEFKQYAVKGFTSAVQAELVKK